MNTVGNIHIPCNCYPRFCTTDLYNLWATICGLCQTPCSEELPGQTNSQPQPETHVVHLSIHIVCSDVRSSSYSDTGSAAVRGIVVPVRTCFFICRKVSVKYGSSDKMICTALCCVVVHQRGCSCQTLCASVVWEKKPQLAQVFRHHSNLMSTGSSRHESGNSGHELHEPSWSTRYRLIGLSIHFSLDLWDVHFWIFCPRKINIGTKQTRILYPVGRDWYRRFGNFEGLPGISKPLRGHYTWLRELNKLAVSLYYVLVYT